ncbi:hypothetical protein AB0K80_25565 [Streptomyces sp. NPDC052682]|uniref:hypothetical protein n=1 Tax=Streptomyces sp. NPDC052682 TaxID=3154954 RepID=UPI003413B1BB
MVRIPKRPASTRPRGRGPDRVRLLWADLVVAFAAYVAGLLAAGLALGGERARDVALGNLAGAALAVLSVAARIVWRRRR